MARLYWLVDAVSDPRAVVIFLHGLGGHAYDTWRGGRDIEPWPRWLKDDLPGVPVGSLHYLSHASRWGGGGLSLGEYATEVAEELAAVTRDFDAPLFLVCHSLGGLIAKSVITRAAGGLTGDEGHARLLDRLRGVVFYATPHGGSRLGNLADLFRLLVWPTPTIRYLARNNYELFELSGAYRNWADAQAGAGNGVEHLTLYETRPTRLGWVVRRQDADPNLPGPGPRPINGADHFSVCKAEARNDERYRYLLDFLRDAIDAPPAAARRAKSKRPPESAPHRLHDIPPAPRVPLAPLLARLAAVAVIGFVGYRGVDSIIEDPFNRIGSALAQNGAPAELPRSLERQVLEILEKNGLDPELFAKVVGNETAPVADTDAGVVDYAARTADRFAEVTRELPALRQSDDIEQRNIAEGAAAELAEGRLNRAERLMAAADLRTKLRDEIEFRPLDNGRIEFVNAWDEANILRVPVPELAGVSLFGAEQFGAEPTVLFHRAGKDQLQAAFADLARQDLVGVIDEWCGSYNPRLIRGSTSLLSTHALGIAFDVNCREMRFGQAVDPPPGSRLARFIEVMERHGFLWGGDFERPDPLHFQLYRLDG